MFPRHEVPPRSATLSAAPFAIAAGVLALSLGVFPVLGAQVRDTGSIGRRLENRLVIPRGGPVVVDGKLDEAEWSGAATATIRTGGGEVVVRFKHDSTRLLFAFTGLTVSPIRVPEVLIDPLGDGGETWKADDLWLHVSYQDCWTRGRFNDYSVCRPDGTGIEANNFQDNDRAPSVIELAVPFSVLGAGAKTGMAFAIAFVATDTQQIWDLWPASARMAVPGSWAPAVIG